MKTLLITVILGLLSLPTYAAPITWYFQGAELDSAELIGSFTYDADTNTYSNTNIQIFNYDSSGGNLDMFIPTCCGFNIENNSRLEILDDLENVYLDFTLAAPMTNTGGVIGMTGTITDDGDGWLFGANLAGTAIITTSSPVPVPAAVWLFGSGLVGLIGVARRKKA